MQFHLLMLLALAAAPVALSSAVNLLNDIPVDTIMDEGTTFVLKWGWDGDANATGILDMASFTLDDSGESMTYTLEDKLNLTMGSYPWRVKAPKGRDTLSWYHSLGITYNDGFQSTSGRSFQIRVAPSSSSSTTTATPTTATTMSSATSPAGDTRTTPQPTSGESSGGDKSNKLGAGAIAGVVVGGIAGIGIFATLIGLVVYYRRKAQREKKLDPTTVPDEPDMKGNPDADADAQYLKPELDAVYAQYMKPELDAVDAQYLKHELDANGAERVYYELDSTHLVLEVEGPVHLPELDSNARSARSGENRGR
ncbi:hypothetical protein F4803DRAFT_554435 [Xylaria telfairii]|nr:hypothetical protein F4803DRAFT_554435 [Xylaria telfairii]